jgi:hypothetical protein
MTARRPSMLVTATLFAALLMASATPQDAWSLQSGASGGGAAPAPAPASPAPCGLWVQVTSPSSSPAFANEICSANFLACNNGYDDASASVVTCPWGSGNCICYSQSLPALPTARQCYAEYEACLALLNPDPNPPIQP